MGVVHSNVSQIITAGSGITLTFTANEGEYLQLQISASGGPGGSQSYISTIRFITDG